MIILKNTRESQTSQVTRVPASRLTLEHKCARVAGSAKSSGEAARRENISLLWFLLVFHFHPGNRRKNKPTNFHRRYKLWQLRFLEKFKIVNLFHINIQARYPLLKFSLCLEMTHTWFKVILLWQSGFDDAGKPVLFHRCPKLTSREAKNNFLFMKASRARCASRGRKESWSVWNDAMLRV